MRPEKMIKFGSFLAQSSQILQNKNPGQKGQQTFKSESCIIYLLTYIYLQTAVHSSFCFHSDSAKANTIYNRALHYSPTWAINGVKDTGPSSQTAQVKCSNTNHQQQ